MSGHPFRFTRKYHVNFSFNFYSVALIIIAFTPNTASAYPSVLEHYLWHSRLLMIFAPSIENPELKAALSQIELQESELIDRDLVVGLFIQNGVSELGDSTLSPAYATDMSTLFSINEGEVSTILIGKDGVEKLRFAEIPDLEQIFSTIDQMPMRMQEMRNGQSSRSVKKPPKTPSNGHRKAAQ